MTIACTYLRTVACTSLRRQPALNFTPSSFSLPSHLAVLTRPCPFSHPLLQVLLPSPHSPHTKNLFYLKKIGKRLLCCTFPSTVPIFYLRPSVPTTLSSFVELPRRGGKKNFSPGRCLFRPPPARRHRTWFPLVPDAPARGPLRTKSEREGERRKKR